MLPGFSTRYELLVTILRPRTILMLITSKMDVKNIVNILDEYKFSVGAQLASNKNIPNFSKVSFKKLAENQHSNRDFELKKTSNQKWAIRLNTLPRKC